MNLPLIAAKRDTTTERAIAYCIARWHIAYCRHLLQGTACGPVADEDVLQRRVTATRECGC